MIIDYNNKQMAMYVPKTEGKLEEPPLFLWPLPSWRSWISRWMLRTLFNFKVKVNSKIKCIILRKGPWGQVLYVNLRKVFELKQFKLTLLRFSRLRPNVWYLKVNTKINCTLHTCVRSWSIRYCVWLKEFSFIVSVP